MLLLCLVGIYLYNLSVVKQQLRDSVSKNELKINQLIDIAIAYNLTIADQMKDNLTFVTHQQLTHPLQDSIKDFPKINSYGLQGNEKLYGSFYNATLSGIGSLEDVDEQTSQEITAALMLDLSTPINARRHKFIWSYYTSRNNFLLLSPNVGINTFYITESIYNKAFWKIALPENNPNRETVISDTYYDAAGQGQLISISTPIYYGSEFKGAVSLDISITYLADVLESTISSLGDNLQLISTDGAIIANDIDSKYKIAPIQLGDQQPSPYQFVTSGEDLILLSNIIHNKFYVAYRLPHYELTLLTLKSSISHIIISILVFSIFYLIIRLIVMLGKTKKLSQIDGLSQIYNRQTLEELSQRELNSAKRRQSQISVIMLDIDYFKKLNDTYGHKAGDNGIKHIAKLISNSTRKNDVFGRYGGEEFLITLPDADINSAIATAEKLRLMVEQSLFDQGLTLTISLGCAEYNPVLDDDIELHELYSHADKALYQAKNNGRNRVEKYFCKSE